jgi:hypothetical protein
MQAAVVAVPHHLPAAPVAAGPVAPAPAPLALLIAAAAAAPVDLSALAAAGLELLLFVTPTISRTQQAQLAHRH